MRLESIDAAEMQALVVDAWAMVVPTGVAEAAHLDHLHLTAETLRSRPTLHYSLTNSSAPR